MLKEKVIKVKVCSVCGERQGNNKPIRRRCAICGKSLCFECSWIKRDVSICDKHIAGLKGKK